MNDILICNKCGWQGEEKQTIPCSCEGCDTLFCPKCGTTDIDELEGDKE